MVHCLLSPKTDCAIMCHENVFNLFNVPQHPTDMHLGVVRIAPQDTHLGSEEPLQVVIVTRSQDYREPGTLGT